MDLSEKTRRRLQAAATHAAASAAMALAVGWLTLALWYPGAHREMAGGRHLFWLLVSVDAVMGPLLTLVIFDISKPRRELVRDVSIIVVLQLGALAYGMHVVFDARPIAVVFEVDRFRVISANQVLDRELAAAPAAYRSLPLTGPWMLGTRAVRSAAEKIEAIELAMKGFDEGQRPSFWQPYSESRADALSRSRPIALLLQHDPRHASELTRLLESMHVRESEARFLPVMARGDWVAILDGSGNVAGYAPFDGFF